MTPRFACEYPQPARSCTYPPHLPRTSHRIFGKSGGSPYPRAPLARAGSVRRRFQQGLTERAAYLPPFSAAAISLLACAMALLTAPATHGVSPSVVFG